MSAAKPVTLLPVAPFLLELQSERLPDALRALVAAGFRISNVPHQLNRYRIEDAKESPCAQDH